MMALMRFAALHLSAAVFGIGILFLISVTSWIWQPDWLIHRYDALFVFVLTIQILLVLTGLETWREARVIFVFHIVGVAMEIFKTSVGAWVYPEEAFFRIGGVPLFTGFMYSAVGSYIARFWRLSKMHIEGAPPRLVEAVLAVLIYVNFMSHHFLFDIRMVLFAAIFILYFRCVAVFNHKRFSRVSILLFFMFAALAVYAAENIGSLSGTWLYPNQLGSEWQPVPVGKLGSWFMLMLVSFALVRSVQRTERSVQGTETRP